MSNDIAGVSNANQSQQAAYTETRNTGTARSVDPTEDDNKAAPATGINALFTDEVHASYSPEEMKSTLNGG